MQSRVSHFIDIFTAAIKNIRNMHAVSTNVDILDFNDHLFSDTPLTLTFN